MSATVPVANIIATLKLLQGYDAKGALAAFSSQDTLAKIIQGEIAVDEAAKIVAVFCPPAAVFANDLEVAIDVEEIAIPLVQWFAASPAGQNIQKATNGVLNAIGGFFTRTLPTIFKGS